MKKKAFLAFLMSLAMILMPIMGSISALAEEDETLVMASLTESISLLPWENLSTFDYYVTNAVYDTLMYASATYEELEPRVAESYSFSEDNLTLTFNLRSDVTFHDGTLLTAEDVVYSMELYIASPYFIDMSWVDSVTAADDTTVVFTMNSVVSSALWTICKCQVFSKAAYEEDPDSFARLPISCGPYMIVSNESGSGVTLTAYEDYYLGEASIKDVQIDIITDSTTLELGLQDGSIDYAQIAESSIANLSDADGLVLEYAPSDIYYELFMNCENEILSDVRVRQAIAYAINTEVIVNSLLGGAGEVNSFVPLSANIYEWNDDAAIASEQDLEKAQALLEEAGITLPLDLGTIKASSSTINEKILTVIQSNLSDIGIEVEIEIADSGTIISDMMSGNYELLLMTLSCYDSIFFAGELFDGELIDVCNYSRYADDDLTAMFEDGLRSTDEAERQEYANNILEHLSENLPSIKLCDKRLAIVYNENLNVTLRLDNWVYIYDMSWNT